MYLTTSVIFHHIRFKSHFLQLHIVHLPGQLGGRYLFTLEILQRGWAYERLRDIYDCANYC